MEAGMHLDKAVLVTVLENKLAQAAVREAHLEAGVQSLMNQTRAMQTQLNEYITEGDETDMVYDSHIPPAAAES